MQHVEFIEFDHIWLNELIIYFFSVDGITYAISAHDDDYTLLDGVGTPIEDCDDVDNIRELLLARDEIGKY